MLMSCKPPAKNERTSLRRVSGTIRRRPTSIRLEQLVGVARQTKEVVFLLDHFGWSAVLRAQAVAQLVGRKELFAADAVQAAIVAAIDVAAALARFPERSDAGQVARVDRGSDEVVVRDVEHFEQVAKDGCIALDQRRDRDAFALRGEDVGQTVVVSTRQEPHVFTCETLEASKDIGLDKLQRMPDMRCAVDVRNRSGNEAAHWC